MEEENGKTIPLQPIAVEAGVVKQEGEKSKQYLATIAVCLGALVAGTVLSWTSPALPILENENSTVLPEPATKDQSMWIGSLIAIGALLGAIPTGMLADKIGRKWTIRALALPYILSWVLIVATKSVAGLYAARIFAGIATGGICVVAPMYIGEISEGSVRGALGSFFQLLLTIGILFSYLVGAFVSYDLFAILCGILSVVFLVAFFFMPETPLFLIKQENRETASMVLQYFRGRSCNIKQELEEMQEIVNEERKNKASIKDLVSSKANRNALVVSLGLMVFQQLSGVNAVIFYTADIFAAAGSDLDPSVCAIIVGVVQVIITYVATLLVDRAGRKLLLLVSSSVMCICLVILGVYFFLQEQNWQHINSIGWVPLLCVNVFIVCFSLGFGPLPWMMMSELFSSSIKGPASGIAVTLNWTLVFIVTRTFADLQNALGASGAFWVFGAITGLGFVFVLFRVPETKNKTFAQIQEILAS